MPSSQQNAPSQSVLFREIQEFLIDREAQRLAPATVEWYRYYLRIRFEYLIPVDDCLRTCYSAHQNGEFASHIATVSLFRDKFG